MKHHELKIWPVFFKQVISGRKTFEFRKDDRGFLEGDIVTLKEWDNLKKEYSGQFAQFKIGYVFRIDHDFVVFSMLKVTE